jgi:hypothetical protein
MVQLDPQHYAPSIRNIVAFICIETMALDCTIDICSVRFLTECTLSIACASALRPL